MLSNSHAMKSNSGLFHSPQDDGAAARLNSLLKSAVWLDLRIRIFHGG